MKKFKNKLSKLNDENIIWLMIFGIGLYFAIQIGRMFAENVDISGF
jgi:hypothetical protein